MFEKTTERAPRRPQKRKVKGSSVVEVRRQKQLQEASFCVRVFFNSEDFPPCISNGVIFLTEFTSILRSHRSLFRDYLVLLLW